MRETRLSGSVEGVMGNHDSYSDVPAFVCYECDTTPTTRMMAVVCICKCKQTEPGKIS